MLTSPSAAEERRKKKGVRDVQKVMINIDFVTAAFLKPGGASLVLQGYESAAQPTECRLGPALSSGQPCPPFLVSEAGYLCSALRSAKTT